jgi:hypothetical protein
VVFYTSQARLANENIPDLLRAKPMVRALFLGVKACRRERGASHGGHGRNGGHGEGEVGRSEDIEVWLINKRRMLSAERLLLLFCSRKHCYFGDRTLNSTNEN